MSDFWTNFNIGLEHMLNSSAYFHLLFLLALTVPYEFKSWQRILILLSLFTFGHWATSMLCVLNVMTVKSGAIGFLVPIIIFITAFYNIVSAGKTGKSSTITFIAVITSFYGIIHGLGYSNYFNGIFKVKPTDKLLPLLEFTLGLFFSQIIIAILSLLLAYMIQNLFKFSKRDWILMVSAFVVGVVVPLIFQSEIWPKL